MLLPPLIGRRRFHPYDIGQSLLCSSGGGHYLTRTPAVAGSQTTWTWAGWVRRGVLGGTRTFFEADDAANNDNAGLRFDSSDRLQFFTVTGADATTNHRISSARFRDPAAWLHVLLALDTTQATAADRVRLYVNGIRLTAFDASADPAPNAAIPFINTTARHNLSREGRVGGNYFDGHLAEIVFVDGQALGPDSFGRIKQGAFVPTRYAGAYGANGFRLDFADSAGLGRDASGNGNDWTPSGLVAADQVSDSPTNSFPLLNPIAHTTADVTFFEANRKAQTALTSGYRGVLSTHATPGSGKWAAEFLWTNNALGDCFVGVTAKEFGNGRNGDVVLYRSNGDKEVAGTITAYGAPWAVDDRIRVELDQDANEVTFFKNNVGQGAIALPAAGQGAPLFFHATLRATASGAVNVEADFGQLGFNDTPTAGFRALSTANLPKPSSAIMPGTKARGALLYTGDGASGQAVTGLDFSPALVWLKARGVAKDHRLSDTIMGTGRAIYPNLTGAEGAGPVASFDSGGFTVNNTDAHNVGGETYVGWCFRRGAAYGFDVVSYTGSGVARTISHGLGNVPKLMIVKDRDSAYNWVVYHASRGAGKYFRLNTTDAEVASSAVWDANPTSSVFSVGTDLASNASGDNYVAYLFAEIDGFSRFGSYDGNGSTDGPFVHCGFRPALVLHKRTDVAANWAIKDAARDPHNPASRTLVPNDSAAEAANNLQIDLLSNGFKWRDNGAGGNASATYVFAAFAETPFKYANAR